MDALGCQRIDHGANRGSEGHAPCRSAILEDSTEVVADNKMIVRYDGYYLSLTRKQIVV